MGTGNPWVRVSVISTGKADAEAHLQAFALATRSGPDLTPSSFQALQNRSQHGAKLMAHEAARGGGVAKERAQHAITETREQPQRYQVIA